MEMHVVDAQWCGLSRALVVVVSNVECHCRLSVLNRGPFSPYPGTYLQ